MSISPDLERIAREEIRHALGVEVSPVTIGQDLTSVLSKLPLSQARTFAARISDAAMEYLVATVPPEPDPAPAAPAAPAPSDPPATTEAVAEPAA